MRRSPALALLCALGLSLPRATPATPPPEAPLFRAELRPLRPDERDAMVGVTWREGCPVGLEQLSMLVFTHWTPDGGAAEGRLVVSTAHGEGLREVVRVMWTAGFPLTRVAPAHEWGGDDNRLMAENITSAHNCRAKTGGGSFSEHSWGHAIDVNPRQNPYIAGAKVLPPEGARYQDRTLGERGMITAGDPIVAAFAAIGWGWGGAWTSRKDYQHFSATGR
jgi:hypothetical protein